MKSEKDKTMTGYVLPLYVQVAHVLGWTDISGGPPILPSNELHWMGFPPSWYRDQKITDINPVLRSITISRGFGSIPRFDTNWGVSGPLFEKLVRAVGNDGDFSRRDHTADQWNLTGWNGEEGSGPTLLLAFCRMIIRMGERGPIDILTKLEGGLT